MGVFKSVGFCEKMVKGRLCYSVLFGLFRNHKSLVITLENASVGERCNTLIETTCKTSNVL